MFHFDVLRHVYAEIQIGFIHVRSDTTRTEENSVDCIFFVGSEPNGLGSDVRGECILIEEQQVRISKYTAAP